MNRKKKICFVVTIPEVVHAFLKDHIDELNREYDVYLAGYITHKSQVEGLAIRDYKNIRIYRKISIINDLKSTLSLYLYIRKNKFDVVHSLMPKAGLVASVSSFLAGVSNRIHTFTGQVWATKHGVKRLILKYADKLICLLDNQIILDGKSQRDFMIDEHVVSPNKSIVFGEGSICGVNVNRFIPDISVRKKERDKYNISGDALVFIFLGRLNHDKGTYDLLSSFNRLAGHFNDVYLLLAGDDEEYVMNKLSYYNNIKRNKNLFYVGYIHHPEIYLQIGDVFCLPSYREGFGSSVIEAACLGIPSICSDVYGLKDAMVDNVTGLRCKVNNIDSLYECMKHYYCNRNLIALHGKYARERVLTHFSGDRITKYWMDFYRSILS